MNVDNKSETQQSLREIIKKYDGIIKTENLVSNDEFQTFYITAKVPFEKFDHLLDDLSMLGIVHNKNIEIKGDTYTSARLSNLDITLFDNHLKPKESEKDRNFGTKSADAISSGWNVIGNIMLFLLPFWPVYLIAGIGYYFYKKKNSNNQNPPANKDSNENS